MDPELTTTSPTEAHSPSFFAKYKFTLISLLILILAIVPLAYLSRQQKNTQSPTTQTTTTSPTPTVVPFTSDNAQPTIDATDQSIQAGLTQSDTDLQAVNQIDSSSDNVTGL